MPGTANLIPYGPGQSGNPNGRPVFSPEIRKLRDTARTEVIEALARCMVMDREQLQAASAERHATMAQLLVASVMTKAIKEGCPVRAQFMFNYIVGRPKQAQPHDVSDMEVEGDFTKDFDSIPSAKLIDILREHGTA